MTNLDYMTAQRRMNQSMSEALRALDDKPRIRLHMGVWDCWTMEGHGRREKCTGYGFTPAAAYASWLRLLKHYRR